MKNLLVPTLIFLILTSTGCNQQPDPLGIEVAGVDQPVISLNGTWKFSMSPPEKFWDNELDLQSWSDIQVPGECQMQGFAIQHDIPYVYKKQFEVPPDYIGNQIFLYFYGVYSHARIWVNGKFVREHFGGFTKWSSNITEFVTPGETTILTVEITDRSDDISYGSGYAKHQIGGILRDVELVALPDQHFQQLYFETDLDKQYENAELKVFFELSREESAEIRVDLYGPDNKLIGSAKKNTDSKTGVFSMAVDSPQKWDAEHPVLYTAVTTIYDNGKELYRQSDWIGFREVVLDGNKLLVNGMPVKLRGACRHDIHPTLGRMTTPEYDLKDVLLARESNMNFIRTSHYPPSEAFLDYCDQYGIYVEDETAVCFVGSHRTEAYRASGASQDDPEFTGRYLTQLEEMVRNHRNHPSVIIWSIGNENVFGDNFIQSFTWVKENDPTRPIIYSYPGQVPDSLTNYEILSMHYPSWQGDLIQYGISTSKFSYDKMPVLFDEWAHVACYNNFELKEDPNVRNFWGQSLDSMWTYAFEADGALGGAIWCMLDETFALPPELPGFNQWWGILDENVIPAAYMGPCVGYGEWGIVDTWRRKKPEFWGTKKAYSPTRVLVKRIDSFIPGKPLTIPVHNRFDHTNFNELKIFWKYAEQSGSLEGAELKPHQKGYISIPANSWKEGEELHLDFYQNDTLLVDRYELHLGHSKVKMPVCQAGDLKTIEKSDKITLSGKEFRLEVNPATGLLEDVILGRDTLIKSGPYLNLRVPGNAIQYSTIQMDDLAKNWVCTDFMLSLEKGIAVLKTEGQYDTIKAFYTIRIDEQGNMEIDYSAIVNGNKKNIQEAGIKFLCGDSFEKIIWKRDPYFTAYPDSHPGRAVGESLLSYRPESEYRKKPGHGWEHDTRGFYYYGLDEKLPYSNEVRSLKEHIYEYALRTRTTAELKIFSEGDQACRFDLIQGKNTLLINDQWDYNSLRWGNYMKQVPLEKEIHGKMHIALISLSP